MSSNSRQNFRTSSRLWIVIGLVFAMVVPQSMATKCEPIRVGKCKGMQWTLTHMPNLVHHSSQENAELVLSQFQPLLDTGCSKHLEFFLCSMFTPMCFQHNEGDIPKIVPPCRKICEDARRNCEPIMLKYNVTWPEQLYCGDLPEYHRGMCIEPDAFILRTDPEEPPECSAAKPVQCGKCKRFKVREKIFLEKDYDFVVRAKVEKVAQNPCDAQVKVNITNIFKMKTIVIGLGSNIFVFNNSCACPKLKRGREYVLGGHENSATGELLLNPTSMAEKWGKKWEKKINKWVKKKAKTPLNRRRRNHSTKSRRRKPQKPAAEK